MSRVQTAKRGLTSIVGSAGEYLVMGELLRRGVLAALVPKNAPGFDILATDRRRTVHIRVKTKLGGTDWQWNAASGDWRAPVFKRKAVNDYCVLVDLARKDAANFLVVKTGTLERWLMAGHKEWLEEPGVRGQGHSSENTRRILRESSGYLKSYPPNHWNDGAPGAI